MIKFYTFWNTIYIIIHMETHMSNTVVTEKFFLFLKWQILDKILQSDCHIHLMIAYRTISNEFDVVLIKIIATMPSHLTSHTLTFLIEDICIKLHSLLNKC